MCIKVELGIRVEILPVMFKKGNCDPAAEPFRLFRPETGTFEDGYARYHQRYLSAKNATARTSGNFIPAIKVFKHLRSLYGLGDVSFHIECLLHSLPDPVYSGSASDYITTTLKLLASTEPNKWYDSACYTPCGERNIFTPHEWRRADWNGFHANVTKFAKVAEFANRTPNRADAIRAWQALLGDDYFPASVT